MKLPFIAFRKIDDAVLVSNDNIIDYYLISAVYHPLFYVVYGFNINKLEPLVLEVFPIDILQKIIK